jgi:hypothetical protein
MRRFIAILGVCMLGVVGCHHVGGKCDCGPQPGESALYAPYQTNKPIPTTTTTTPPVIVPATPVAPTTPSK